MSTTTRDISIIGEAGYMSTTVKKRKSVYDVLSKIDLTDKVKEKNGMRYLPWSSAWAEMKRQFPNSTYRIIPSVIDEYGNTRPWHINDKSGWVEVGVTPIGTGEYEGEGIEHIEPFPIMDLRYRHLPAENITSVEANKAIKRCLTKACAYHGLGAYLYEGEELPDEIRKADVLRSEIMALMKQKSELSAEAKAKVKELAIGADENAGGDPRLIESMEVLEKLKLDLLKIRKSRK